MVVVATEFGRTARINGTDGTDHGTGTIALLAGGAVKGGRVIANWPGLKPANLYEGRDLAPTTDLRAVIKKACCAIISASPTPCWLATVFPKTSAPVKGDQGDWWGVGHASWPLPVRERGEGAEGYLFRYPVDLRQFFRAQLPVDRLDVLLDLFDAGGAGDHA